MLKQISVFLENRAGRLNEMTEALAARRVDLRALNIAETSDYGLARIIADDTDKASAVLKEVGALFSVDSVVAAEVPDVPGGLNGILKRIAAAGIDIHYMYSGFGRRDGQAVMIFRVAEPEWLEQVLRDSGISPIEY